MSFVPFLFARLSFQVGRTEARKLGSCTAPRRVHPDSRLRRFPDDWILRRTVTKTLYQRLSRSLRIGRDLARRGRDKTKSFMSANLPSHLSASRNYLVRWACQLFVPWKDEERAYQVFDSINTPEPILY